MAPFRRYTTAEYTNGTVTTINDASLTDITPNPMAAVVPATSPGWKYIFSARAGEKVLADSATAGGVVLFTTYQPDDPDPAEPCRSKHLNRAYAVNIGNGHPALDFDKNNTISNADLFEQVKHDGILGGVNIAVLRGQILDEYKAACAANSVKCTDDDKNAKLTCIAGMHVLGRCVNVGDGGRSYWRKQADSGN
jgi:Tfp pilus tip-associated adhesin PilY1